MSQGITAARSDSQFARLRAHLLAQLVCLGRHTLTGLLSTNGQLHRDWSADYRLYSQQRIEPAELFSQIRRSAQQSLEPGEARNPHSVQTQPAVATAAYGLLLLAASQSNLQALSQPKWRSDSTPKRLSTASLIDLLRHELWNDSIRPECFTDFRSELLPDHNPRKPRPDLRSALFCAAA